MRSEANHRQCFMVSNKGNSAVPGLLRSCILWCIWHYLGQFMHKRKNQTVKSHIWCSFLWLQKHFPGFAALGGLVIVANNTSQICSGLPGLPRHGQSPCGWQECVVSLQPQVLGEGPGALPAWLPSARPLSSTEEGRSCCMTLLHPAPHPPQLRQNHRWQAVKEPKPEILMSGPAAGQSWEQLFTSCTLLGSLWKNLLTAGHKSVSHRITFLGGMGNSIFLPFLFFFSIFFQGFQISLSGLRAVSASGNSGVPSFTTKT